VSLCTCSSRPQYASCLSVHPSVRAAVMSAHEMIRHADLLYIVSQKNIPDIIDCNLKNDYPILIIFGRNIPDTTGHQMTGQFFTLFNVSFCTSGENGTCEICVEMNKSGNKFYISGSVDPSSQLITRFECHAAVCLPDDVQECWWIQEAPGKSGSVWSRT